MNIRYLPIIKVIEESFEIPDLKKKRRITALLPWNYYESQKTYPVLYLQDGQNLFDDTAPFGSWSIDTSLGKMAQNGQEIIVVAIDHGGKERIKEYTPTIETKLGPGDGKKYIHFVINRLKKYVDKTFRTLPDRLHTGIGGSSMGGLISIYGAFMHPEIFGRIMVFSPSLWVMPNIHFSMFQTFVPLPTKIYLYGGGKESETMVPNIRRFKKALRKKGSDEHSFEFHLVIDPKGEHTEIHWGGEFPHAVRWLFFG